MRVVLQRVFESSVSVNQEIIGSINCGLLLLLGFGTMDNKPIVEKMIDKIIKLRIFGDEKNRMNLSLLDIGGELLIISQFTLYANTLKGNRPSFTSAASPNLAKELYEHSILYAKTFPIKVDSGSFGANMKISLINDGPVTIWLNSEEMIKR